MSSLDLLRERVEKIKAPRVMYSTVWNGGIQPVTENNWRRHKQPLFRKKIHSYDQITVNTAIFKNSIGFDVDNPEIFDAPDLIPSWRTYNKDNDKHHVHFLLEKPFCLHNDKLKEQYRDTVQIPLEKIAFLIGADPRYRNTTTKNPFNTQKYRVSDDGGILKSVYDLINQYSRELSEVGNVEKHIGKDNQYISAKYRLLIADLIEHSMLNSRLLFTDPLQYEKNMFLFGEHLGADKKVIEDAILRGKELSQKYSELQAKRIKKRWNNQIEDNKRLIKDAIDTLKKSNSKITYGSIAVLVNCSPNTLRNNKYYSQYIQQLKKAQ